MPVLWGRNSPGQRIVQPLVMRHRRIGRRQIEGPRGEVIVPDRRHCRVVVAATNVGDACISGRVQSHEEDFVGLSRQVAADGHADVANETRGARRPRRCTAARDEVGTGSTTRASDGGARDELRG